MVGILCVHVRGLAVDIYVVLFFTLVCKFFVIFFLRILFRWHSLAVVMLYRLFFVGMAWRGMAVGNYTQTYFPQIIRFVEAEVILSLRR